MWGSYDLVALNGATGALKWRAASANRVWPGVAVADLTGDGTLEVVVGRSGDQVTVYNAAGGVVWSRNPFGSGEVRTLAVEDLEHDGALEIVAGRASGGDTKQLDVFSAGGTPRAGWPARRDGEPGYGWGMYNENVAVADLNGDGYKEIFGPTDTHYITALDRDGGQLPANAIYGAGKVWSQVGVHVDHAVDLRGYANCGVEHRPNFADSAPRSPTSTGTAMPEIMVVGNVYNCGDEPLHEPLPDAVHHPEGPHALERERIRLDRDPGAGPRQRPAVRGLQRHRDRGAEPGAGRPRRGRPARDPLPLLRRQAPRLLARQDRARELALRRAGAAASASPASRWWPTSTATARPR